MGGESQSSPCQQQLVLVSRNKLRRRIDLPPVQATDNGSCLIDYRNLRPSSGIYAPRDSRTPLKAWPGSGRAKKTPYPNAVETVQGRNLLESFNALGNQLHVPMLRSHHHGSNRRRRLGVNFRAGNETPIELNRLV